MKAKPQSSHIFAFAGTRTCTCKAAQLPCAWQRLLEHSCPMLSARRANNGESMHVYMGVCTQTFSLHCCSHELSPPGLIYGQSPPARLGEPSSPCSHCSYSQHWLSCTHCSAYGTAKLDGGASDFMVGIGLKTPQSSVESVPLKFITIRCFILFTSVDCVLRGVKNYRCGTGMSGFYLDS